MPNDALQLMKQIPLFRQLGEGELNLVWAMGQELGLPAGYSLETPADQPPVLWILLEGRVDATFPTVEDGQTTIHAPEVWGASTLVPPFRSPGLAVTATPCRVLRIYAREVRMLAEQSPRLGVRLYEELATRFAGRFRGLLERPLSERMAPPAS